jgi:DNA-binding winged helix-turn-helix (wHTH) protein/Tol biopolymer transport system component
VTSNSPSTENGKNGKLYEFGPFTIDAKQGVLLRDGEPVKIPPKTFQLLRLLVENNGQVVDKATIMQEIWPNSFVEDANLTVHISTLRKTLNGDLPGAATIETFPKVGYKFQADLRIVDTNGVQPHVAEADDETAPIETTAQKHASRWWPAVALAVVGIIVVGGAIAWFVRPKPAPTPVMIRVPGTENSSSIALSPDGQYIAHAISKFGKRALTMTNIGSGSSVQLTAPDEALYYGMKFSKDNSYLFFVRFQNDEFTLSRIPVLGGQITTVMRNSPTGLAISPDGSKICYVRRLSDGSSVLYTANPDGSDENEIARRSKPENYSEEEIAWSPDGTTIADLAGNSSVENGSTLVGVDVATGKETVLSYKGWAGGDGLGWLPDGSALVAGLFESGNSPTQVWLIPIGGEPRVITSDLENYGGIDISADGQTIMAGQFKDESSLWVQPAGQPTDARPVTNEKHHMFKWVRWAGDELVFASSIGPNRDIWMMNVDGANERQLTENAKNNVMAGATRDGKTIYYCSNRAGKGVFNIYRSDAEGQNVVQMTFGGGEFQPAVSPDGKWVYYTAGNPGEDELKWTIWKVAAGGGDPIQLTTLPSLYSAVSPDSRFLAFWIRPFDDQKWKVGIMETSSGRIVKYLDIPRANPLAWTSKGDGVSFIKNVDGVGNIWTQPVNGGPPIQETKFTSDQISNFDWSAKGELVCTRTGRRRDVFLIRNFR